MRSLLAPAAAPALLLTLLLAAPAHAESADAGPQWDDRHMQSNFANRLGAPAPIAIVGSNRFGAEEAAPPTAVQEQVLHINPHGWQPGGARGGASSRSALQRPAASSEFSSMRGARPERNNSIGSRSVSR